MSTSESAEREFTRLMNLQEPFCKTKQKKQIKKVQFITKVKVDSV